MENSSASTDSALALLDRLKTEMPEIWSRAQFAGHQVWIEFSMRPVEQIRTKLKSLGFRWNPERQSWQHRCGQENANSDQRSKECYGQQQTLASKLNEFCATSRNSTSKEFKIVAIRECPMPEDMHLCDTPDKAAEYWQHNIATNPYYNPECECFAVLMLNTRRRVKGHNLVTIGTLDTILVHAREVFRVAIVAAASAIVVMHNHPSGEPQPSEADIKVTRDLIRAGQLLKIEVLDHVIMGNLKHCSLRELGYFYSQ
jgi:DNA repair protein RadC